METNPLQTIEILHCPVIQATQREGKSLNLTNKELKWGQEYETNLFLVYIFCDFAMFSSCFQAFFDSYQFLLLWLKSENQIAQ